MHVLLQRNLICSLTDNSIISMCCYHWSHDQTLTSIGIKRHYCIYYVNGSTSTNPLSNYLQRFINLIVELQVTQLTYLLENRIPQSNTISETFVIINTNH